MDLEFQPWPKIYRLFRPVIVTEKIDGTNAAVVIERIGDSGFQGGDLLGPNDAGLVTDNGYLVYAQSRKKIIAPGKSTDNYGFAAWVREHAASLVVHLGEGRHYGEWFGKGIQGHGYGLSEKWFALFNVQRWANEILPWNVTTVPVLYEGEFSEPAIRSVLDRLSVGGSRVGVGQAEGIVVYFPQANTSFKVTLQNDGRPKGAS